MPVSFKEWIANNKKLIDDNITTLFTISLLEFYGTCYHHQMLDDEDYKNFIINKQYEDLLQATSYIENGDYDAK